MTTGPLLALLAVLFALACGCAGPGAAPPAAPTPEPPLTATTVTPTIAPPTTPPEPFPGALRMNEVFRYGAPEVACEVTIYRVFFRDEYNWWSKDWGRYWNTTPREGNRFLFVFIRFRNTGTTTAILPGSSMFVVHADGTMFKYYKERDPSITIQGISEKGWENPLDFKGGWIYPGDSNRVEGFLVYEVPEDLALDRAYLEGVFSGRDRAVWKLG